MIFRVVLPLVLLSILAPLGAWGFNPLESENSDVSEGNELLANGQFGDALASYDEAARQLPGRSAVHLNRGLALSRMGDEKTDEAMQAFSLALDGGAPKVRARAHSNLGNMFFKKEDFAAAIEHYKKSLMLAPGNKDVAWNLELAAARKKQQEEEQKEQQKDDQEQSQDGEQEQQDSSGDDEQQNQDKNGSDENEQNQEQEQDQQPQSDEQKKQQESGQQDQQQPQQQPSPKTRQEMEQILDSLEKGEDNLAKQKARQRGALVPRKAQRDW